MKKIKISDLKNKNNEELEKMVKEKQERLDTLIFKMPRKEVKNYKELGMIKKDIARILTVVNSAKN
ncbi:MAG: 50S ribosomal protein L29 [Patescibacteria group bacterium]